MPLQGRAVLTMWWEIAPAMRAEFEDWHTHEHFPERLGIPGFRRGSRWADANGGDGIFVIYELEAYETLTSPHYLARLNDPTPWSTKMMPHHRNMVRSQCRVVASHGGAIAGSMLTLRLSPELGQADLLDSYLRDVVATIPKRPGIVGGHVLHTHTPEIPATKEQRIRGGADAAADWIVLVSGYDAAALRDLAIEKFGANALGAAGARAGLISSVYRLSCSMVAGEP